MPIIAHQLYCACRDSKLKSEIDHSEKEDSYIK